MEILKTENLTKVYGKHTVVDNVSMTINKGDIYGFVGENGAGKTTLMRMILTLANPSSGSITLFGSQNVSESCRKVGSLIETPSLPKNLTADEIMRRYALLYGAGVSKNAELLELVGLNNMGKITAGKYSLGMRQRLGIAIALIGDPEFLLLDEPVNGLDPTGMKEIRDLIAKINRDKGVTVLISSHLLAELSKLANKIGIIHRGKLLEEISMDELMKKCKKKIKFIVDNPLAAKDLLENAKESLILLDGNVIYLEGDREKAGRLNALLVKNNILVSGIETENYNLEDYYLEKVGATDVKNN